MVSEQVRLASVALGPLLRKRGTSPALGAGLRRAVQALDRALVENDEAVVVEAVREATKELQECLPVIHASARVADRAQLEGISKVLSLLGPAETASESLPVSAAIPAASADVVPETVPDSQDRRTPSSLPLAQPPAAASRTADNNTSKTSAVREFPTVHLRVEGMQECLRILRVALESHLATLGDFEGAHSRLRKLASAVRWLGTSRFSQFRDLSDQHPDSARQIAADLALVHLGDHHGVERLLSRLGDAARSKKRLPSVVPAALRAIAEAGSLDLLLAFFGKTDLSVLRALLLPVLAEREALSAGRLLDLALDPDDDVAANSAEALAWGADASEASLLFAWAMEARSSLRANALLFSATVLGSPAALNEARRRLAKPAMSIGYLATALAIAGDESDAERLLGLAARPNPDTSDVVLAAANLGAAKTLSDFQAFADRVPARVLGEARRRITGAKIGACSQTDRLLYGAPWSVSRSLHRLADPSEPLRSADWSALEVRARTGLKAPSRIPLFVRAAVRAELLAGWQSHYANIGERLPPGGWYYQGKSVPSSDKKGRAS
jgi:hypothetical protein